MRAIHLSRGTATELPTAHMIRFMTKMAPKQTCKQHGTKHGRGGMREWGERGRSELVPPRRGCRGTWRSVTSLHLATFTSYEAPPPPFPLWLTRRSCECAVLPTQRPIMTKAALRFS